MVAFDRTMLMQSTLMQDSLESLESYHKSIDSSEIRCKLLALLLIPSWGLLA